MKVLLTFFLLVISGFVFADFVVDIPFDLDIIGPSFSDNGPYEYETEWITLTNTGAETQTYTLIYNWDSLPAGWYFSICTPTSCFIPNFPTPIELEPGGTEQIHALIGVESTGGFNFTITFEDGDLSDPLVYQFSFNTADNVGVDPDDQLPVTGASLGQNYPNPFNPTTSIAFELNENGHVSIEIYNLKGERIKTLINGEMEAGNFSVTWNGTDSDGKNVTSGIFFYKMRSGKYTSTKKMILMK